jgi:hypothetical protein
MFSAAGGLFCSLVLLEVFNNVSRSFITIPVVQNVGKNQSNVLQGHCAIDCVKQVYVGCIYLQCLVMGFIYCGSYTGKILVVWVFKRVVAPLLRDFLSFLDCPHTTSCILSLIP